VNRNREFEYYWRRWKLHCDMTNFYSNENALNLYAKIDEVDLMLTKRTRMKTKMNVWSTRLRQKNCLRVFSCKLVFISFLCIELLIFIRKTRFFSYSKTKMCWKKKDSRRISKRRCVERKMILVLFEWMRFDERFKMFDLCAFFCKTSDEFLFSFI
jgi:hypothetical protein